MQFTSWAVDWFKPDFPPWAVTAVLAGWLVALPAVLLMAWRGGSGPRSVAIDPEDAGVRDNAACLYALAGESERALDLLESALRAGFGTPEWIRQDPDLVSLVANPRFEALVAPRT